MTWRTRHVFTSGYIVLAAIAGIVSGVLLMFMAYQPLACP